MASHNSKYYVKRLTKGSSSSLNKIDTYFKKKCLSSESEPSSSSKQGEGDLEFPQSESSSASQCGEKRSLSQSQSSSSDSEQYEVPVPDARKFSPYKYELQYRWLYYSVTHEGYMCTNCELFGVGDSNTQFVTQGVKLTTHSSRQLEKHETSRRHKSSNDRYAQFNCDRNVMQMLRAQERSQLGDKWRGC